MLALISDIHANIEALNAVLEDMAAFPVERICCLGDVIGYGPNPRQTLEVVRRCEFVLLGNHEEGLLYTDEPVLITDANGTYEGGGFRYLVEERRFRLIGGARVVQQP